MKKDVTVIKPNFKTCMFLHMQTLTNFPFIEDDFDALTNYELLCKVVEYLNKVIANENVQNENIEQLATAFNNLKSYVDNYFDNLDIQDEINNKLDEMAESGELTDIIAQYLQLAGVLAYNTIADMSNAENLVDGSICRCLGNDTYNDGKGAFYKIRPITSSDIIDGINIVALDFSDTLIAERISNYYINQLNSEIVNLTDKLKNKINKYIPNFIANNDKYYIRIGSKENNKHFLQFSTDLISWHTICDLPYEIFMQPTSYPNTYDLACFIHNDEFYIVYDYVDEDYNNWSDLDPTKFLFGNRIGITKTSDFITWEKYAVETPLEYKQIANPRTFIENGDIYLALVANDGTLTSDESSYYHFPVLCKLNSSLTATSNYIRLLNTSENVIDPFIYKDNGNYYLFVSFETPTRSVKVYKSTTITTQFTTLVDTIDYKWNLANPVTIEGASLIKKDNLYYLIMDSVDHINVINITNNIESWNNCFFATTDNIMGNAQVLEINSTNEKTLMKKFYEVNDYPIFNKFPQLKGYDYNYFNQTKTTITFYPIANKVFIAYFGPWNITVDKSLLQRDTDYCNIINDTGSSNNLALLNIHGNNTTWYLPNTESCVISRSNIISNGRNYYVRHGHEAVTSITANTVKKITLSIPGISYGKCKSIQLTPFTSGSNTKQVFTYVDALSNDSVTFSILSNENISAMELYWTMEIE